MAVTTTPAPVARKTPLRGEEASKAVKGAFSGRVATIVVTVVAVLWTIPTVGLLISSVRPEADVALNGWWNWFLHPSVTLNNYSEILFSNSFGVSGGLSPYFVNSLVITIPATLIPIALASMAAYALAWIPFRGANIVFFTIFALQVVPLQLALVPLLQLYSNSIINLGPLQLTVPLLPHISGTLASVWLSHCMFAMPLAIFLLHNFIAQLPKDLMEAARIDGASHFVIFRKIVLPLSTPALASFAIFQFLWVWNDLLIALTFAGGSPATSPITSRLAQLTGSLGSRLNLLTAGAFVAIVIPLAVFFSLQRYFVRGLLAGSVKG